MIDPAIAQFIEQRLEAFMREAAARTLSAQDKEGQKLSNAMLAVLKARIEQLELLLRNGKSLWDDLQPRVFLIKKNGGAQWQEQTVIDGNIQDFIDGRKANSNSDPTALIEPPSEVVAVIEIPDGGKMRCVRIGGGSERIGQLQYMMHTMVAQGVDGWDDVRGAPERG